MLGGVRYYSHCYKLAKRFKGYQPKDVGLRKILQYLGQFDSKDRKHALNMLDCVQFIGKSQMLSLMYQQLAQIVDQSKADGILPSDIILVPASAAGDSSAEVHKLMSSDHRFRDLGVTFFSGTPLQLANKIKPLSAPIVVFVDDFAGSGEQFCTAHKGWSSAIQRYSPTTYFLACVMCSPAIEKTTEQGVIPSPGKEHTAVEMFSKSTLSKCGLEGACILRSYAEEIHSALPLGFKQMGCMVVLYRNSSNNMPFLLRGTLGQRVWKGLFPRSDQVKPMIKALV